MLFEHNKATFNMKKSQIILSFLGVAFAVVGAFASTSLVGDPATVSTPSGCISGTTTKDGCTLTQAAGLERCKVSVSGVDQDAFAPGSPSCFTSLWRQP